MKLFLKKVTIKARLSCGNESVLPEETTHYIVRPLLQETSAAVQALYPNGGNARNVKVL